MFFAFQNQSRNADLQNRLVQKSVRTSFSFLKIGLNNFTAIHVYMNRHFAKKTRALFWKWAPYAPDHGLAIFYKNSKLLCKLD